MNGRAAWDARRKLMVAAPWGENGGAGPSLLSAGFSRPRRVIQERWSGVPTFLQRAVGHIVPGSVLYRNPTVGSNILRPGSEWSGRSVRMNGPGNPNTVSGRANDDATWPCLPRLRTDRLDHGLGRRGAF